jgi:hypothetical protein
MALSLKDVPTGKYPQRAPRKVTAVAVVPAPAALMPWQLPHSFFEEAGRYELPLPHWDWLMPSTVPLAVFQILQHTPKASWRATQFQDLGREMLNQAVSRSYWLSCVRQRLPQLWQNEGWWPLRIPVPRFLATEQK